MWARLTSCPVAKMSGFRIDGGGAVLLFVRQFSGDRPVASGMTDILFPWEKLFASLDDIYAAVKPERVVEVHVSIVAT